MRRLVLLTAALAGSAATAQGFARIKSRLPPATVQGDGATYAVAEPDSAVKVGGVGPETVIFRLRRAAAANATGALVVTLTRDGRQIARFPVGGKPRDAIAGSTELAGPLVERTVPLPPGPRALTIEVGAGAGKLLVHVRLASDPLPTAAAAVAAAPPDGPKEPEPAPGKTGTVASIPLPSLATAEEPKKPEAAPGPRVSKLDDEATPDKRPAKLGEHDEEAPAAAAPAGEKTASRPEREPVGAARVDRPVPRFATEEVPVATARPAPPARPDPELGRVGISARVGLTRHLQLPAPGPAVGVAVDVALFPRGVARLSVDYVSVTATFRTGLLGPGQASGEFRTQVWSISALVSAVFWPALRLGPVRIFGGAGVGLVSAVVSTRTPDGAETAGGGALLFGAAPLLGVDAAIGPGRLAIEARVLVAAGGRMPGGAENLQPGGLIGQATYRLAL